MKKKPRLTKKIKNRGLKNDLKELERKFILVLDHATGGTLSRTNYDVETICKVIDEMYENNFNLTTKEDLSPIIEGLSAEEALDMVKNYFNIQ